MINEGLRHAGMPAKEQPKKVQRTRSEAETREMARAVAETWDKSIDEYFTLEGPKNPQELRSWITVRLEPNTFDFSKEERERVMGKVFTRDFENMTDEGRADALRHEIETIRLERGERDASAA